MSDLTTIMNDVQKILEHTPVTDIPDRMMLKLGKYNNAMSMEALTRVLVVEYTRARHARAKLELIAAQAADHLEGN